MKKKIILFLFISSFCYAQNAWINEFHYDNDGGDVSEFVEIAIEDAYFYDLSQFTVNFYNGNGGASYDSEQLSEFTEGDTYNDITLYYLVVGSIQNGSPDGISLDFNGTLIQFLSYEGTFAATDGPAIGVTSTDIGVSEPGTTPIGYSLQLVGAGTQYIDFTWSEAMAATMGHPNTNQALPVELTTFTAAVIDQTVELNWETATEVNNYGFEVERQYQESSMKNQDWEKIGFVNGHGNSNSTKYYSYSDNEIAASGKYLYRLKQIDFNGAFEFTDAVEANLGSPNKFELTQNYPNPFNPITNIEFNLPKEGRIRLSIFNVLGEEVSELLNENISAGFHNVKFDGSQFNSGIYFYKLEADNFMQIKKMMLVK